ncbi:MAG TPA: hypothetical protein PKH19_02300 [Candidatus Syntrophosphaera sp.]|nr:hypothetical protein [Candidatus Syntrophosphaera sp.]
MDETTMPDLPPELMDLYRQAAVDQSMRQHEAQERDDANEAARLNRERQTLEQLIANDQLPEAVRPYVTFDWRTSTSDYRPFRLLVSLPNIAPIMVHWVWGGTTNGPQPVDVQYLTPTAITDDEDGAPIYTNYYDNAIIFAQALYNAIHYAPSMKTYITQKAAEKAQRENQEQAEAAALMAEADHDEGIRQLLMETDWDPVEDQASNYLHGIDYRLTAIGMLLRDIRDALRQQGEK